MPRHQNLNWNCGGTARDGKIYDVTFAGKQLAVLMDIRDELQKLNTLLGCPNFVGIPRTLRTISRKIPARRRTRSQT